MKQRITALDLKILTRELNDSVLNYRLQNIYNVLDSPRHFLLKFSIPDSKKVVMVDLGNRINLTDFDRVTDQTPSNFVTKLRKHLKTRRVSGIKQIGNDRSLVLQFSDGQFYLVFEFFSAGNILLLDENKKILIVHRIFDSQNETYRVNETCHLFDDSLFTETFEYTPLEFSPEIISSWITKHKSDLESNTSKKNKVFSIHKLLFVNCSHIPSELIKKKLHDNDIKYDSSCLAYETDDAKLSTLVTVMYEAQKSYIQLTSTTESEGVILLKRNKLAGDDTPEELRFLYDQFHPFVPLYDTDTYKIETVQGYNKTLDKFFSNIESKKNELNLENKKQAAMKRLTNAREERTKQIDNLIREKELNVKRGDAIIFQADLVSQCTESINLLIQQQMDWSNIENMIRLEQSNGNKIAQVIQLPLNLLENKIKLKLLDSDSLYEVDGKVDSDGSDSDSSSSSESDSDSDSESSDDSDSDEEEKTRKHRLSSKNKQKSKKPESPTLSVWIDLSLSPYANARLYFDTKKNAEVKQAKVEKNTEMALNNVERKINADLAKSLKNEKEGLSKIREKHWFEKFYWFLSTDGYLCLSGNDDLQNDMIYYRYFNDNDVFVSSDLEGSLKVFIKNPYKGQLVAPSTLWQAGMFALSGSTAWNNKSSNSAWWMPGEEISKKDFDGSLLSLGKFDFKGKKQYMPPAQLTMGVAIYWVCDDEGSKKNREKREKRQEELGLEIVTGNKKKDLDENVLKQILLKQEKEEEEDQVDNSQNANEEATKPGDLEETNSSPELADDLTSSLPNLNITVRGKKSKLKKIQKKYADQDEDERKLRMSALGTLKQIEENQQKQQTKDSETTPNQYENKQRSLDKRQKQDQRELRKYILEPFNQETNFLGEFDNFLQKPSAEDELVSLVPVFAPWQSLSKFKYKAKITPGNNKKGKSMNEVLDHFNHRKLDKEKQDPELDWPNERELIKSLKSSDLLGIIPVSKLKVVLPSSGSGGDNKGSKPKGGKSNKSKRR